MRVGHVYLLRLLSASAVALLLSSCGEVSDPVEGGLNEKSPSGMEEREVVADQIDGGGEVSWPELNSLKEVAYTAGVLAENRDRKGLLHQRTKILEAGWAVSPRTMPENVADHDRVHLLLGELASLVNGLARSDMPDARLFALAGGIYPVVEKLIDTSKASSAPFNESLE